MDLVDLNIPGQNFKKLKKYINSKSRNKLKNNLIELFNKYEVKYKNIVVEDKTNSIRQSKYMNKKLSEGQKRVSFWLDDINYSFLLKLKNEHNITTSELFIKMLKCLNKNLERI